MRFWKKSEERERERSENSGIKTTAKLCQDSLGILENVHVIKGERERRKEEERLGKSRFNPP